MVLKVGEIYSSNNCGDMEIIEYINARNVRVQFIATGYERLAEAGDIRLGSVKDLLMPSVHNVGYLGGTLYKTTIKGGPTKEYQTWRDMLCRCYDPKSLEMHPTYNDCTVAKEWHNFQTFSAWFTDNYIEGYQLDKDIKVPGNRVYGPDTCMFVTPAENTEAACALSTVFASPEGVRVEVTNIRKFSRGKDLDRRAISRVKDGKQGHHKGWKLWKEETKSG